MTPIISTDDLEAFCRRQADADFLAIDTEFMREGTYWPRLCLVQIAGPDEASVIDPLADGIDLSPLFALVNESPVIKVFHSARQDIEIFFNLTGRVPSPLFDTQVAAMVCGFGESVGYETLVSKLAGQRVDKTSRFTDWSRRPLSDRQLRYALADVVHLRPVYMTLLRQLEESGRTPWLEEEFAVLTDPATYAVRPENAWRRIKTRSTDPKLLAVLRELASWREREAQSRDLPRGRVVRDDALIEIAARAPRTPEELATTRGLNRSMAGGWQGRGLLGAVEAGLVVPKAERPKADERPAVPTGAGPLIELLKVLLKMKCEAEGVAQKLVATTADLERLAIDDGADIAALRGWRRAVFGNAALALKHGRLALTANGGRIEQIELDGPRSPADES